MYKIKLRLFNHEKDRGSLYSYMSKLENQIMFSHKFQVNNDREFCEWLNDRFRHLYHDFFMIETDKGETIGFTYSYEFFSNDGHLKFALCLFEEYQNKGYGPVAALHMLKYLFTSYSINQVFTTVFDYNQNSLQSNLKGGFDEVGVLPNYRFYDGKYHSLHYLTMSREKFSEIVGKYKFI